MASGSGTRRGQLERPRWPLATESSSAHISVSSLAHLQLENCFGGLLRRRERQNVGGKRKDSLVINSGAVIMCLN